MNREKGLFRLAVVLTPIFGVLGLILNKIFSFAGPVGHGQLTLVQTIWNFMTPIIYQYVAAGKSYFIAFVLIGTIPLLTYCAYKFVLGGFYPEDEVSESEGSSSEDKVGEEVQGEIDKLSELQTQLANLKELDNPEFATMIEDLREEIAWLKIQLAEKTNKYSS